MTFPSFIAPAFALALTLGAACAIQAQTTQGAPPPWASEPAPSDHTKDIPSDEALLRQHLAGGDSGSAGSSDKPNAAAQKARPSAGAASASGQVQGQVARGDGSNSVADAVKDFVKPLHQEVNSSEVVKAVREIDATVSGRTQANPADGAPGYSAVGYGPRGNDAPTSAQTGRKSDPNAAALLWQQFVDEVLPWVIGAAALVGVGYVGYFWLKMMKIKRLKQGDKRRAERTSRHSERHPERPSERKAERYSDRQPQHRSGSRTSSRTSSRSSNRSSSRDSGSSIG